MTPAIPTHQQELQEQARHLRNQLNRTARSHGDRAPSTPDYQLMLRQLQDMEKRHPHLVAPDSPTHRAGHPPSARLSSHIHTPPLPTPVALHTDRAALRWYLSQPSGTKLAPEVLAIPASTGVMVVLYYHHGILTTAATVGDGITGTDITDNARTILSIPLSVPDPHPPQFRVLGEILVTTQELERLNRSRIQRKLPPYSNAHNTALALLRTLDSRAVARTHLQFLAHDINEGSEHPHRYPQQTLNALRDLGFPVHPAPITCRSQEDIRDLPHRLTDSNPGVQTTTTTGVHLMTLRSHSQPAVWHFQTPACTTTLKGVEASVGRTGRITYTALLSPVVYAGLTLNRASFISETALTEGHILIGDTVEISRPSKYIPTVIQAIPSLRDGTETRFKVPTSCPACDSPLSPGHSAVLHCQNLSCPAQFAELLKHYASKKGMDIPHLGPHRCQELADRGIVTSLTDLYTLTRQQLLAMRNLGQPQADAVLQSIEDSKTRPLTTLLCALGIPNVGTQVATTLAGHYNSLERLATANQATLLGLPGIGDQTAHSIATWFRTERNRQTIQGLSRAGVNTRGAPASPGPGDDPEPKPDANTHPRFRDRTFVITSKLPTYSRVAAEAAVRSLGGTTRSTVSNLTSCLVTAQTAGRNLQKATDLGIEILTPEEFEDLLEAAQQRRKLEPYN